MIERLVHTLIASSNEAADDLLLEALDLGSAVEKRVALGALLRRNKLRGLAGVVQRYPDLPDPLKLAVLENIQHFGSALSDCGRSLDLNRRLAALKLIALGRRARLGYVLLENLGDGEEKLQRAAVEAIVALARWVATESRKLQQGLQSAHPDIAQHRPLVEDLVFKALERAKSTFGGQLTLAALLLADWGGSQTLAILRLSRHPGRIPLERRLSQPPDAEHAEAFLLGASHGGQGPVRSSFAGTFAHLHERPTLDALLRKTHWLKDQKLAACVAHVAGGRWLDESSLARDLAKRATLDVGPVAEWVAATGAAEVVKDLLITTFLEKSKSDPAARLRLFRTLAARPHGASLQPLKAFLTDDDQRLRRLAAREIARRRPVGYQTLLMSAMAGATPSVTQVIGRAAGEPGFRAFWRKYDRLDDAVRRSAGRAVVRILPAASKKFAAMLHAGPIPDRIRLLDLARQTDMVDGLRTVVLRLCAHTDIRLRSKAVTTAGSLRPLPESELVDRLLHDDNPRVRANAIDALDSVRAPRLTPVLAGRTRADNNRERANAIKALLPLAPSAAGNDLADMLRDPRPAHRISALWAVRQAKHWSRLADVGRMARADTDVAVRRYALGVLKNAASQLRPTPETSAVA